MIIGKSKIFSIGLNFSIGKLLSEGPQTTPIDVLLPNGILTIEPSLTLRPCGTEYSYKSSTGIVPCSTMTVKSLWFLFYQNSQN